MISVSYWLIMFFRWFRSITINNKGIINTALHCLINNVEPFTTRSVHNFLMSLTSQFPNTIKLKMFVENIISPTLNIDTTISNDFIDMSK